MDKNVNAVLQPVGETENLPQVVEVSTNKEKFTEHISLKPWSKEWSWEIRGSLTVIMGTITLAIFTDIFVYAVVVPVVPYAFMDRMDIPESQVQSKVSIALAIYSAGMIVGSIVFGYISDKMQKRQTLMIIALLVIIGSTFILCFAKVLWLYFVGRLVQGISASMVWTVGLAIIADTGDADNMAYLMSFPGIGLSLGMFLGPFVGGVVYEQVGYYPVFYVCFGILTFDIVLRIFMLEKSQLHKLRHKRALELNEQDPSTLSSELFEYMTRYVHLVDDTDEIKAKQEEMQEKFGTYITFSGKRYRVPVLLSLLKETRVANAVLLGIASAWIMTSLDTTVPLQLHEVFNFTSLQVGLVFLALAGPSILEPLVGKLSDRYGPKLIISGGFLLLAPVLILLRIPTTDTPGNIALFIVLIAVIGFFLMAVLSPTMAEMTKAVTIMEAKHPGIYGKSKGFGQAYGLFNVGFSLGSLIAPFHAGETREKAGWNTMVLSLGIVCIIISVIAFFFAGDNLLDKWKKNKKDSKDEAKAEV